MRLTATAELGRRTLLKTLRNSCQDRRVFSGRGVVTSPYNQQALGWSTDGRFFSTRRPVSVQKPPYQFSVGVVSM
jgi:hypothetical protein